MNSRLNSIYNLIDFKSKGIADIGTDHALIPIQLYKDNYPGIIVASDINEMPLNNAICNADEMIPNNDIQFTLCDGISDELQNIVDTFIIAGMGGDLICEIIDNCKWICSRQYSLILQPMTKAEVLRYFLVNNGFHIFNEVIVSDRGKYYQILKCGYFESNCDNKHYYDIEYYIGKVPNFFSSEYLDYCLNIKKIFTKIFSSSNDSQMLRYYGNLLSQIDILINAYTGVDYGVKS